MYRLCLCSSLYKDVVDLLKSWLAEKKSVYVYSSGSIEAQKLLFTWSEYGDLTQVSHKLTWFSGIYMDIYGLMSMHALSYI